MYLADLVSIPVLPANFFPALTPAPLPPSADPALRENFTLPGPSGGERTVRVFIPPSYRHAPEKRYPLLVMQDGQNLFEAETAYGGNSWQLGANLLAGIHGGSLREVIAVGVDNDGFNRINEYAPWRDEEVGQGGNASAYVAWLKNVLLPALEAHFRLLPGRENRVIGGSSLGALVAQYAMATSPELFGGAMLMSGSWHWLTGNWEKDQPPQGRIHS